MAKSSILITEEPPIDNALLNEGNKLVVLGTESVDEVNNESKTSLSPSSKEATDKIIEQ